MDYELMVLIEHIEDVFGVGIPLRLGMSRYDGCHDLYITIEVALPPEEAHARLAEFDRWWLVHNRRFGSLCVHMDIVE
jgi:hypothetical protein